MIYLQLFISYLKIGFFGFGGGYSMLSLIQHEVVVNHQWITNAALSDIIAISQMTPGPIAINSATYIGYTVAGFWGSVIATTAVSLPSLTIMVLITRFFLKLKNSNYMERIMSAMRPAVLGMIAAASMQLIFPEDSQGASMIDAWSWVIFAAAFYASMRRVSPIKLIVISAFVGVAIYYVPTLFAPAPSEQISLSERVERQWSNFDMQSPETFESEEFEQAWVDYLYTISSHNPTWAAKQLKATFEMCGESPEAIGALYALGEKYLYNPNSPMRNDELFIPILEYMIGCETIESDMRVAPTELLRRAKMNRIGSVAADFALHSDERMHQIEAPYTMLYFFDPDCHECQLTEQTMAQSELMEWATASEELKIAKVDVSTSGQVDSLYDIKATPTLYLLDSEKHVVLKDCTIEQIIELLETI